MVSLAAVTAADFEVTLRRSASRRRHFPMRDANGNDWELRNDGSAERRSCIVTSASRIFAEFSISLKRLRRRWVRAWLDEHVSGGHEATSDSVVVARWWVIISSWSWMRCPAASVAFWTRTSLSSFTSSAWRPWDVLSLSACDWCVRRSTSLPPQPYDVQLHETLTMTCSSRTGKNFVQRVTNTQR